MKRVLRILTLVAVLAAVALGAWRVPVAVGRHRLTADERALLDQARRNGVRFDDAARDIRWMLGYWIEHADPRTQLFGDPEDEQNKYSVQNEGADLYAHLVLTSYVTAPRIFNGFMLQALRKEVRYTTAEASIPANLRLKSGRMGAANLFGASEYAKDGLMAITELVGRSPWFYRMADLAVDIMDHAPEPSRFGNLPGTGSEINGDMLQVLVRLAAMTDDRRYIEWARRIGDAYVKEVLPRNYGLPAMKWNFERHSGRGTVVLRDHGNELIVGLALLFAYEQYHQTPRAKSYRPVLERLFDRVIESANPDGMLYNKIDPKTLRAHGKGLNDNWGYIYGAMYAFYQATGEEKYREAVRRVLRNLPKYRNVNWETHHWDGYADSIESALYLLAREPVPEAADWIESEIKVLVKRAQPGSPEALPEGRMYLDGNFNRTMLLYALYKSQGCRAAQWSPGLRIGAVRDGERLFLSIERSALRLPWIGRICFDHARHKRDMNFDKNYVRLNEYPEWYAVDENTLYKLRPTCGKDRVRLGSELIRGVVLHAGDWIVEPMGPPPYGPSNMPKGAD